jgi:hypothetical protein
MVTPVALAASAVLVPQADCMVCWKGVNATCVKRAIVTTTLTTSMSSFASGKDESLHVHEAETGDIENVQANNVMLSWPLAWMSSASSALKSVLQATAGEAQFMYHWH